MEQLALITDLKFGSVDNYDIPKWTLSGRIPHCEFDILVDHTDVCCLLEFEKIVDSKSVKGRHCTVTLGKDKIVRFKQFLTW